MQQAQFLAIATIAVYAGAILVMFLFVLMLAQPEGHTHYDRITWGPAAPALAVLAAVIIVGGMTYQVVHLDSDRVAAQSAVAITGQTAVGVKEGATHMSGLGRELFGPHLLAVEVAGTLLLAALVGALAIVLHAREPQAARPAAAVQGGAVPGGADHE
jgi:NADH-quinone oxidoreductase subunit J